MTKVDWALVAAWVGYIAFAGPYLISQPNWIPVGLGFAMIIGLVVATYKRIKFHVE